MTETLDIAEAAEEEIRHLAKLPGQKSLHHSLICLLWLLEYFKATGYVATPG
jgi:hypothetical protein